MLIQPKPKDMDAAKELKVKLPIRYYLHLHSIKVLTGKQISETIEEALEAHFRNQRVNAEAAVIEYDEAAGKA